MSLCLILRLLHILCNSCTPVVDGIYSAWSVRLCLDPEAWLSSGLGDSSLTRCQKLVIKCSSIFDRNPTESLLWLHTFGHLAVWNQSAASPSLLKYRYSNISIRLSLQNNLSELHICKPQNHMHDKSLWSYFTLTLRCRSSCYAKGLTLKLSVKMQRIKKSVSVMLLQEMNHQHEQGGVMKQIDFYRHKIFL